MKILDGLRAKFRRRARTDILGGQLAAHGRSGIFADRLCDTSATITIQRFDAIHFSISNR